MGGILELEDVCGSDSSAKVYRGMIPDRTCLAPWRRRGNIGSEKLSKPRSRFKPTPAQAAAAGDRIEFRARSARYALGTSPGKAGKKGKCPNCGAVFDIPPARNR